MWQSEQPAKLWFRNGPVGSNPTPSAKDSSSQETDAVINAKKHQALMKIRAFFI
jgi:hypothetical protein